MGPIISGKSRLVKYNNLAILYITDRVYIYIYIGREYNFHLVRYTTGSFRGFVADEILASYVGIIS